jgi:TonB family protein
MLTLQVEATQQGIVVTATDANSKGSDVLPVKELGRCLVQIWLTADGYIRIAQIAKTSGHSRLDDACLRGVAGTKMLPSRDDKGPIDEWLVLPVIWRAHMSTEPRSADRPGMPIALLVANQSLPIKSIDYPKGALERAQHGDVFLRVVVSDSGRVTNITVSEHSGSTDLDNAALAAVRGAKFSPAFSDQKAVNSSTDVVVSWILPKTGNAPESGTP